MLVNNLNVPNYCDGATKKKKEGAQVKPEKKVCLESCITSFCLLSLAHLLDFLRLNSGSVLYNTGLVISYKLL